LLHFN
jgi:hypothetical protein